MITIQEYLIMNEIFNKNNFATFSDLYKMGKENLDTFFPAEKVEYPTKYPVIENILRNLARKNLLEISLTESQYNDVKQGTYSLTASGLNELFIYINQVLNPKINIEIANKTLKVAKYSLIATCIFSFLTLLVYILEIIIH